VCGEKSPARICDGDAEWLNSSATIAEKVQAVSFLNGLPVDYNIVESISSDHSDWSGAFESRVILLTFTE
jgi:hypothetical protein